MRSRRRWPALAAVALVAVAAGLATLGTGALDAGERAAVDVRFSVRGEDEPPPGITVVFVDDKTFSDLNRQWPFPRSLHAQAVRRITAAKPRLLAYDVQFTEPTEPEEDNALIEAVDDAPLPVLSTTEVDRRGGTRIFGGDQVLRAIGARPGNTVIEADQDGVLRRFRPSFQRLTTFPAAIAERATGRPVRFPENDAWIDYRGPVQAVSFSDVVRGQVPARAFRDRIVLVGAGAASLQDRHKTPTSERDEIPGVEILANQTATVLDDFPLRSAPGWLDVLLVLGLGLVAPASAVRFSALPVLGIGVGVAVVFLGSAMAAFALGLIVTVASPLVALGLGLLGALGVLAFLAALERERTRVQFARFVPSSVVDDVLEQADGARLGGVFVEATVLFCDLRGSTALLETMSPERGIEVINQYLREMTAAVADHEGTLSGFRGDGLLALFGAPLEYPDHATRAVAAARDMAGPRLREVNARLRAEGLEADVAIGIGVCSGGIMAGNVGSEDRMEYTAIGDAANVAARLEGMTKGSGYSAFVSDSTWSLLGEDDRADLADAGERDVRGREGQVRVWGLRAGAAPGADGPR